MKVFIRIKKHPHIFLIALLITLCLLCLLCIGYTYYRLNIWYRNYIDKGQSGLRVFYYSYGKEDFEETSLVKRISFSSSKDERFQRNYFSISAVGIFSAPKTGRYKFHLRSDDGGILYINQGQIIDNGGIHPAIEKGKTVFLIKGPNLVVIEYFQALGEAELGFNWLKTGESKKCNDLEQFFHPATSNLRRDNILQFEKIIKFSKKAFIFLLRSSGLVFFVWFVLLFLKKIYLIWLWWIRFFKRHKILTISVLFIIILSINFYPIVFKGERLVSYPGSTYVQDGGGPYWEIEPYFYLNHHFYFNIKTLPLWNPYEGTGFPLAAVFNCGSFSPISFLTSLCPSQLTMDFFMLFRLFIAGYFMYMFLKNMRMNSFAVFVGSCFFMLSPPHIACINQFQMDTAVFIPAILFFLEKSLRHNRRKDWVLTAIFIALAVLGGNPEECFLVMSLISLYFFIRLFFIPPFGNIPQPAAAGYNSLRGHRLGRIPRCGQMAGFINNYSKVKYLKNYFAVVIFGMCLAGFFLLPAIEYYKNSQVTTRSYSSGGDLNLVNLLHLFFVPKIPQVPPSAFYISIMALFLALIIIFNIKSLNRDSRGYVLFSLIYIFGFLFMLFNNPFTDWIKKLPFAMHIWWGKYTSTFYVALAIIVSAGLDFLLKIGENDIRKNIIFIYISLVALFSYVIYCSPIKGEFDGNPAVFYYLFIIFSLIFLFLKRNVIYSALIGLLLLYELFLFIPRTYPGRENTLPFPQSAVYLKKNLEKDPYRVEPHGSCDILEANRNCIYQLPTFWHSGILVHKRYDNLTRFIKQEPDSFRHRKRYLDFFGVKYFYSKGGPMFEEDLQEIYNEGADYIYENKRVFPRAFIVHRAEKVFDSGEVLKRITDPNFDFRYNIIVEKDLPDKMLNCRGSPVKDNSCAQFISYTPNRVLIKAVMENDGFLILTDTYYPGWKAYVDGKRSEIFLTDYLIRSVYLEKGEHMVEFRYAPLTFKLGSAISIVALVSLIVYLKINHRGTETQRTQSNLILY